MTQRNESPWSGGGRRLLREAGYAARFLGVLPRYLRRPLTPDEARVELARMLRTRESSFLDLARRVIFGRPANPFRRLLANAGCEYGDLVQLVETAGLEGALRELLRRGVYLTIDEFKRGRPVVRGSTRFVVEPRELFNPLNGRHLPTVTGGSRGARTPASADLWQERLYAVGSCLFLDATGATAPRFALWDVPGSSSIQILLLYAAAGARPARWFSQVDPGSPGLDLRYRWSARLVRWGGVLAGTPMPRPEAVPLAEPAPIVEWLARTLQAREHPILRVSSSAAVRVAAAAESRGVDLRGARFILGSEPVTPGRLAAIRRAGVLTTSVYGSMDAGLIGQSCAAPRADDEMHLRDDLFGVIQPGADVVPGPPLSPTTLLLTSLRPRTVHVFLNLSIGDQADLFPARCGCALQHAGLGRQLAAVRSFEKLNAGGMTLLDSDVIRVLEEVLPARFGGGPLDYQLLEAVEGDGRGALRLLVHPAVGPLDPGALVDAFLQALEGDGAERVRELLWRQGEMLRVERVPPRLTPAGKVLHLHQERAPRAE
jgi:hypothetical protein